MQNDKSRGAIPGKMKKTVTGQEKHQFLNYFAHNLPGGDPPGGWGVAS